MTMSLEVAGIDGPYKVFYELGNGTDSRQRKTG